MNIPESDILCSILSEPYKNQRLLVKSTGHSLGIVNKSIKSLIDKGYLDKKIHPTSKAVQEYNDNIPENAIILAAGFGMRMVPINLTVPKALLKVKGEPLVERQIRQLHEAGIHNITIVVGFLKEQFEYLIDKYNVDLVVNPEYAKKNNLYSLALVSDRLSNSYIIPSDIWCSSNPFRNHELYSWYMISDHLDQDSTIRVNRKLELVNNTNQQGGNAMIGIAYIKKEDAAEIKEALKKACDDSRFYEAFWENVLYKNNKMIIPARIVSSKEVTEINTYEQLRQLDSDSDHLKSDALDIISQVLHVEHNEIIDINILKKGMTNRSFLFRVHGDRYIMRIPGEGTDQLINRVQETEVFQSISGYGFCDDPIYINPTNGYKITKYLKDVRVCDPNNVSDLTKCMRLLRTFHEMKLTVDHTFDILDKIEFYESLWNNQPSIYSDYEQTKQHVFSLKPFIDQIEKDWCLTHIDAVPDNFLFYKPAGSTKEELQLTDWEYAGMQDPHVDIAMFSIYSLYNKNQVDRLIDIYFQNYCDLRTRIKIYVYIAMCGLLWSNWCEFKRNLGVEFGEYSLRQYRYAKDYYRYALKEINEGGLEL